MELDGLHRRAETFEQVTETLRGNPGAQQLARMIVDAGNSAAFGQHPPQAVAAYVWSLGHKGEKHN
jgi:hypothetical protein